MTVERIDEESPLLTNETNNYTDNNIQKRRRTTPTPLPKVQISILMLLQICEPITSQSIYPYINQLISELDITGGDERKVGYYAGLIESLFFVTEAMTVFQWSRASDHIGRKPILLIGLAGSMISMLLFGLSKTFWALVISRCLTGLLNGNIGVMKSTIGDLTDSSNRAEGVSMLPVVWSVGAAIGPLIGGTFARPHERYPKVFTSPFWKTYPYFLPSLIGVSYVFVAFWITVFVFKETIPKKRRSRILSRTSSTDSSSSHNNRDGALPLRNLFTYRVLLSVSNYVALAFLNICFNALLPLFLAMPLDIGGLGLPPSAIGYVMGGYGAATGIFQFFWFAKVNRMLGEKRVFMTGMMVLPGCFAMMPIISLVAQRWGVSAFVWVMIAFTMMLAVIMDMAYGAIFMYITASPPTKAALGATHGLSQTSASISRAIGPALSTSLFSLSVQGNWLGGYAVYAIFGILSVASVLLARRLPDEVWEEEEYDDDHDNNES
ncbi:major facilitator superfamily domain-containing protein [Lentinula detonsa]|uniref:Major facilitator superfamily domain-containing protein n=1 Tax=Lentinula detonsa TaxID=2804962 RepID=A0AA38PXC0_9AGAR|nr:major facilitator superfamily domain-containing protein [Lentinula detonsa]